MAAKQVLSELIRAADELGVLVRREELPARSTGPGGLCWVNGSPIVVLNSKSTSLEQGAALVAALRELGLGAGALPKALGQEARMFVARQSTRGILQPDRRPGPGLAKAAARPKK